MDDNIIPFKPKPPQQPSKPPKSYPPMFNLPPYTKGFLAMICMVHLLIAGISFAFIPSFEGIVFQYAGLVPSHITTQLTTLWWSPLTIITYAFLHAGWLHLVINCVMFAASASGVERLYGARRMLILFFGSSVIAGLSHFAFYPRSDMPIVGASGGISGLFGGLIYLMQQMRQGQNIWRVALIWIGISVLVGMMGTPNGEPVAWLTHVGGFLAGIGITIQMQRKQRH